MSVAGGSAGTLTWTVQTAGGVRPSLAFDGNGRPAIGYQDAGVKYTAFNGTAWSAAQTVDATGLRASLAFNPASGKPQIAFVKTVVVDGNNLEFVNFATLNGTWSVETANSTIATRDPSARSPNLAIDATGKPHIGWGGPFFNASNLDYSYSTKENGEWSYELVEGPGDAFTGEWSSLAINSAGVPAIIYNSHTNGGAGTFRGKYTIRTGGVWSPVEYAIVPLVIDGDPRNIGAPGSALKFDPADVPHVAYVIGFGGANSGVRYSTRSSDGTWTVETVAAATQPSASSVSLAIHPVTGVPYISFYDVLDQNNAVLKVAHKTTGSWEVETIETGTSESWTSTAIDAAGTTLGVAYNGKYAFATISTDLTITTGSALPGGTVGRPYSKTFQRINGTAAFTWSKVSGAYPDSLTLAASTGVLSGTPTTAGQNATFRLRVTDGVNVTAEKDFTLAISTTPTITANATLPPTSMGLAYSQAVATTGGTAPFAWSKTSGEFPDGVTLNPSTGVLSGTPTVANTFNFTVQVTDANGATASKALSVVVNNALAWAAATTSPVPPATVGIAYNKTLAVVGGTAPLTWARADGALPNGVTLNPSTGVLSGTPTVANTFNFKITVMDGNNASVTREFALTVSDVPIIMNPANTVTSLPDGIVSIAYSYQPTVARGTPQLGWSITGNPPAWLTLNPNTGAISGTPTVAGPSSFTLRVTDQNGAAANRTLTLTVQAAPVGPDLSLGLSLYTQKCSGCHPPYSLRGTPSKLILDAKGNHNTLGPLDAGSKTNLALYFSSQDTKRYIINGVIRNAAGQGLEGATVTATSGYLPTKAAVSGANGTYSITDLAPGDYTLVASKSGVTFSPASVQLAVTKDKYWLGGNISFTPDVQPLVPPINFAANQAPIVALTSPMTGTAFVAPSTIYLTATASDPDGSVTKVAFYADGSLLGVVPTAPFAFVWNADSAVTNVITAVATDNLGLNSTSAPVTIQVLNAVGVPGIDLVNGGTIYSQKCSGCHGSPPGRNPTWPGYFQDENGVHGRNDHPGILARRSRYRDFDGTPYHSSPYSSISNYFANVMSESDKSNLSAYLASSVPDRASVFGTVRDGTGQTVAGALVSITSLYNPGVSVATDAAGNYRVEGLLMGDYYVSATYEGLDPFYPEAYTFGRDPGYERPALTLDRARTISITGAYNDPPIPLDFAPGHRVQGSIRNANNRGFSGVLVRAFRGALGGSYIDSALSDPNGDFRLVAPNGNYDVAIPQFLPYPLQGNYTDYTFSPASRSVTVSGVDQSGADFTVTDAPTLTISGKVTDPSGAGMGGVTVSLAEAPSVSASTDVNGDYTLTSTDPGTFTVSPVKANHLFTPESRVVTIGVGSRTNINFTGILNSFYVSGTVRTRTTYSPSFQPIPGEPIANVAVSVPGQTVYTDANGEYRLVLINGTYTVTAERSGYVLEFDTPPQVVTINGSARAGIDFKAQLLVAYASTGGNNNNDGSSWNSAKSSVQKAINITANGGEVRVGGGTYFERISFGGISVYGGGATLNGKPLPFGEQFDRGRVVAIDAHNYGGGTNGTRLDGFTIINGLANSPSTGGGIYCNATDTEAGPVVIANNRIADNFASFKGGGIFLNGKATITNNVITGNSTGFGPGAGIQCDFSSKQVTIANNFIARNTADSGGGGIGVFGNSILIANNTIVENVATNSGTGVGAGGIYFGAFSGNFTNANNVIAFNSSGVGTANSEVTNRNNCVFGNTNANYDGLALGTGDVSVNPQFANPDEFNYRLLATSPLLNSGNNNFIVGVLDLDGAPRVEGGTVDIGAYEYQAPNTPPAVTLVSPVNGASYSTPAAFTMIAQASDADGALTKVEFYAGQALLGTVTSPPHVFSVNGLQVGTHLLTAVATDNRGAITVSAAVTVTVHPATDPTVSIASPVDGTRIAAPAQISLQANAADGDGSISKVEFFVNGTKVGEKTVGPFNFTWPDVTAGTYALTAKATDNSGASRISTPVSITVVNAPQILQPDTVYTGGEFRLPMMLETGKSYLIQASTNLVTWTTIQSFQAFGNAIEFVDTEAGNYPGRFYRIVLLE